MFRMYGKQVELYRYIVRFGEDEIGCISEAHRDEIISGLGDLENTVEAIDQTENEWMNGMEFASYDVAKNAMELGQEGYLAQMAASDPITQLELAIVEIYEMIGG